MQTILVTGGSGMIGSNFIKNLIHKPNIKVISLYHKHQTNFESVENICADICDKKIVDLLSTFKFNVIIHCAAMTNISDCENNPALAKKINVSGSKNIVLLAKKNNSKIIYISTDAVFKGDKGFYNETDKPNPQTVYGKTKLVAENFFLENKGLVIRTNVFGKNNFLEKLTFAESIIETLNEKKTFSGFIDAKFSPIFVSDLFYLTMRLIKKNATGIFHVGGSDKISKYEFAKQVAETFGLNIELVQKASVNSISSNICYPKDLTLDCNKLISYLNEDIPSVKEGLIKFKKMLVLENG